MYSHFYKKSRAIDTALLFSWFDEHTTKFSSHNMP